MNRITAEQAARAIVAACMLLGVDPAKAFDATERKGRTKNAPGGFSARVLAAHGVRARLGVSPTTLGKVFQVHPNTVAPSQRAKYGITTDQLLAVSEALGPVGPADARERFMEPLSGVPTRSNPRPDAGRRTPDAGSVRGDAGGQSLDGRAAAGGAVRGVVPGGRVAGADRGAPVRRGSAPAAGCAGPAGAAGHGGGTVKAGPDDRLVRACLAQGGFPVAVKTRIGTVWAGPDGRPWAGWKAS